MGPSRSPRRRRLYGLRGFTHGGAHTLTVLAEDGGEREWIGAPPGVTVHARPGYPTVYHERHAGALDALIATHGIEMLDKPAWDARRKMGSDPC